MSDITLEPAEVVLVCARGEGQEHGLYRFASQGGRWSGERIGPPVKQLSALCRHPSLPVVYGTSGTGQEGRIHAWRIAGGDGAEIDAASSGGAEPCHLAVDPSGRLLIVTNYTSSALGVQRLAADGGFEGPIGLLPLTGGGVDPDRQDAAHPHQALFAGGKLVIIDLGADLIREYALSPDEEGVAALSPTRTTAVPPGTGPRHAVVLPDGRLAVSGELGSSLVIGRIGADAGDWIEVPGTTRAGPARTRHLRNYPGDIQRSADGRHVYFANRGYDTISTFDVAGATPVLVSERDSSVAWPQHLLVLGDHLLIAGWDSSEVVAMPLNDGQPDAAVPLFACSGAGWLMRYREDGAG